MGIDDAGFAPVVLTVYSRKNCRLCDEMLAGLQALQTRFAFDVEVTDVDADPGLMERYGEEVPVLAHQGRELCRHRLEPAALTAYLSSFH